MQPISVCIPVGPYEGNRKWLQEAINSALNQTQPIEHLVIIDDMAGIKDYEVPMAGCTLWHSPWRLGVASAFNIGVALAPTNYTFMLGSDDTLAETCIANCSFAIERARNPELSYFYVGVRYSDGREDQFLPCHAAMVSKTLWRHTGGFSPEMGSGASDAAFISIMLGNPDAGELICVNRSNPLYNYRVHDDTDTAKKANWQGVILATRDILTREWSTNAWKPDDSSLDLQPSAVR